MFILFQSQIVVLAAQISWSEDVESALHAIASTGDNDLKPLEEVLTAVESTLNVLADSVLQEQPPLRRKKLEHLVSFKILFCTLCGLKIIYSLSRNLSIWI